MGAKKCLFLLAFIFCLAGVSQGQATKKLSSLNPNIASETGPEKEVYDAVVGVISAWNRHDIPSYLSYFWNDPLLSVVIDGEQYRGFASLSQAYIAGYPNKDAMGSLSMDRVQVQMIKPDVGFALMWYSFVFESQPRECGKTRFIFQNLNGWKIIVAHTSFLQP